MEHSEKPISDPHITSCLEIEEKRIEAEKAAVVQVIQQINTLVEQTTERDEKIIRETKILGQELAREEIFLHVCAAMETIFTEQSREEIKQIEQLYQMLTEKLPYKQNLDRILEYKRMENKAILHADPIFALIQEEARLKRQLEELGIHVPPPNDP
ncbi:uncharacterized protein [Choristoneura fumiferana]|uniref:uncharacterized protein n=1 Tax=Choristoneura fumiferana TaxID=7141 RepID=UPI003D15C11F